jgi:hypothetical protein
VAAELLDRLRRGNKISGLRLWAQASTRDGTVYAVEFLGRQFRGNKARPLMRVGPEG